LGRNLIEVFLSGRAIRKVSVLIRWVGFEIGREAYLIEDFKTDAWFASPSDESVPNRDRVMIGSCLLPTSPSARGPTTVSQKGELGRRFVLYFLQPFSVGRRGRVLVAVSAPASILRT
jgi:hypothetical protein